jgi:dTDP-4-amino-4,6-dideoxygalactose transaminase
VENKAIQMFTPKFEVEECLNEIRVCLEKGWTGMGFKTVEFEEAWKNYTGLNHAHFINSNTVGLHLALDVFKKKYKWDDNAEVITTPLTFISTNHAILYANLKPVFADVDQYLCLDPVAVESKITPNTKAVMYVGIGGNSGQYTKILELCRKHGLKIILDAAHMAGTRFEGKHIGHDADVTIFSFQAVKNLPTADSGMICFYDKEDDELVRKLTWLGINKDTFSRTSSRGNYKWHYDVEHVGFKYHGNSIMGAIALVQLKYLDRDNAYRRQIARWYTEALRDIDGIKIVPTTLGCESAQHLLQIIVEKRDECLQYLNDNDIFPGVHYRDNTNYRMFEYAKGTCPNSEYYSDRIISLPLHLGLTNREVNRVIEFIKAYLVK